ncbi:hypothetical protein O181_024116 [Austropuccinia psidii MF-1]|uniref:Uncharacterized protein n=1 Tax=Austropuccinia psidii MF-1 TaxID=1389203 RepID=A0A9Q3CKS2_9BASI|nr:hypothetical protein [Austropuccinia psidii MF-1]
MPHNNHGERNNEDIVVPTEPSSEQTGHPGSENGELGPGDGMGKWEEQKGNSPPQPQCSQTTQEFPGT